MSDEPNEPNREFWNLPGGASAPSGRSRALLGGLLLLVAIAVILAIWSTATGDDESANDDPAPAPTPIVVPTSTPAPPTPDPTEPTPVPTSTPEPTPVPDGFEACDTERAPLVTASYIVDTVTTPLNQRADPSVDGELVGTFDPGQTGLIFTGDCLVNLADGYVWWAIYNGTDEVWIASDFVTPN